MRKDKFLEKFPDLEGFTIGELRVSSIDPEEVKGFVLIDKDGKKRYILYLGEDCRVEPYW